MHFAEHDIEYFNTSNGLSHQRRFFQTIRSGYLLNDGRGPMEVVDECRASGHQMDKNEIEKFYLGGKGSAPLGAYAIERQHHEGRWHAEDTKKNME